MVSLKKEKLKISIFVDDSGVLCKNDDHFVYAGYIFLSDEDKNHAKRKFISLLSKIKKERRTTCELKASELPRKHKNALYNVMKNCESFHVYVPIKRVKPHILNSKRSITRFKDYALKRGIKEKMKQLIKSGLIDPSRVESIIINVDEQLTSTDGIYSFNESITEELLHGIYNFDYDKQFEPILFCNPKISTHFCDSSKNYLIQASDILANRVRASYAYNRIELRKIPNHKP